MNKLYKVPRLNLANLPTPLERLSSLSKLFRNCNIFIKRDDLTGHCFGGNKERKLEFISAEAIKNKAETLVTVGSLKSNHCRMVTSVANRLGMEAELILIKSDADKNPCIEGNHLLNKLMKAKIHIVKTNQVNEKIQEVLKKLKDDGRKPYFIEGGGHNVFGVISYIFAMKELKKQIDRIGMNFKYLVLPSGTGTTQAGLILGKKIFDMNIDIIGISVARQKERCIQEIKDIIDKTIRFLGIKNVDYDINNIVIYDKYIGKGYAMPTRESARSIKILAEKEGMIVDPIYNSKALAGMFDLIKKGTIAGNIVYLNTGGIPNVFVKRR
jgi:D-cysteine desulfhydrase family pyridoxal phosphate-dependent enzyme